MRRFLSDKVRPAANHAAGRVLYSFGAGVRPQGRIMMRPYERWPLYENGGGDAGTRFSFFGNGAGPLKRISFPAIIGTKNKNAAACGCYQHPQACTGEVAPTQRPKGRTAWNIIRHSGSFYKGAALPFMFSCFVLHKGFMLLTLCRNHPARRFCFSPGPRGRKRPRMGPW